MGLVMAFVSTRTGRLVATAAAFAVAVFWLRNLLRENLAGQENVKTSPPSSFSDPPPSPDSNSSVAKSSSSSSCDSYVNMGQGDASSSDDDGNTDCGALSSSSPSPEPVSVNYHFTRRCNYACAFCFHVAKDSYIAPEADMRKGMRLLKEAGMRKINFAGGEPFLYPQELGMLVKYCKVDLGLESVSIISNGSKITEKWLSAFGQYVDVLGISCDSFDSAVNIKIGRGNGTNVTQLFRVRRWCRDLGIKFKLNTVINKHNWQEDMMDNVERLAPFRWKCFQVLIVEGKNDDEDVAKAIEERTDAKQLRKITRSKRNAEAADMVITDAQFEDFCQRHKHVDCFVPESNELMASSYLILDEYLRFLDKGDGKEKQSASILEIGVSKALNDVRWDQQAFESRGGYYQWSKDSEASVCCTGPSTNLDW